MKSLTQLRSGQLSGATRFNLACGLTEFPREIFELSDSLEILDLSKNQLTSLPDDLPKLKQLRIIFLNNNHFREIPPVLADCPNLSMVSFKSNQIERLDSDALPESIRWLILTDNQLEALPRSIGKCTRLQKFMLAGNRLTSLPDELAGCTNLELIRLAANQLTTLPSEILRLPKLSWLAYAGNPFAQSWASKLVESQSARSLPKIPWSEVQMGEVLGQGASGVISQGVWTRGDEPQDVAIKFFKGDITSDGFPADEQQACVAAGQHPHLVQVLGRLTQHPKQKDALIFALIPESYRILGKTPSLESCTRDVYPLGTEFSWAVISAVAQGMASVASHLHQRGMMHGDLYPHNILFNDQGNCFLSDFGAASFFDPDDQNMAQALQRIEVRAFGCLLEDLLDHCAPRDQTTYAHEIEQLRSLQQDCITPDPSDRPLFQDIGDRLAQVTSR